MAAGIWQVAAISTTSSALIGPNAESKLGIDAGFELPVDTAARIR